MPPLSDNEILAQATMRVRDAVGYLDSTLVRQREKAMKYYRGDLFGNEQEGRSQVVSRDVAQHIDTVMPSIMRIFSSGDEVVRFEPQEPGDEAQSAQATDYVNWIWSQQNDGFVNFHTWFKDALLNKIGVLKIWWDDTPQPTRERYQGLSEAEFQALEADEDIEVIETAEDVALSVDPATGQPVIAKTYDAQVVKTNRHGRVCVAPVPPEEFMFGRRAKSDKDADVLGHRTQKPRADLLAAGFDEDIVNRLFSGDDGLLTSERLQRFADVDDSPQRMNPPIGGSAEVEVVEAFLHLDVHDDGTNPYIKVTYSGSTLLDWEEVDDHPFAIISPILMPHRLVGMSMSDQLEDVQLIKSTVLRQVLDNLYLTNTPQLGVVEGQVNLDDLLTRRPGGLVRQKSPGSITPIPTTPLGQEPYSMIEYLDTMAEARTGATRYNQGLDANTLNHTATGINLIQNAAAQRIELIARVFAETGVKRAFKLILKLVCAYQQKAKMIKLRGEWVEMDPRAWRDSMDMTVSVGLGNGNRDQVLAQMMGLLQMDEKIIAMQGGANGPLVTLSNVYAKLKKVVEASGLRSVETYYTDPAQAQQMPPQQPKPDPKMAEVQARMQLEQAQGQARLQLEEQKAQHQMQLAQQKAQLDAELAKFEAEQEAKLAHFRASQAVELDFAKHHSTVEATQLEGARALYGAEIDAIRQTISAVVGALQQAEGQVSALTAGIQQLADHATAPRELVRDETGRLAGVRIGGVVREITRGPDGRPVGVA